MVSPMSEATRSHIEGQTFELDGVQFLSTMLKRSNAERFAIAKNPPHVERYRELLAGYEHPNVVELGILQGGGVAMLALLADPKMLVAVDLSEQPIAPLANFVEARGLTDRVKLHYGVDQADQSRLTELLDDAFGHEQLDVVIDDASHIYEPTRASFEVLFPRLRPGGVYLIEDWQTDHTFAEGAVRILHDPSSPQHEAVSAAFAAMKAPGAPVRRSMSRLAIELMLTMCSPLPAVQDVSYTENWIHIERGDAPLGPGPINLEDLYTDPLELLGP
jgi:predicted O-methyltransferase YrrM